MHLTSLKTYQWLQGQADLQHSQQYEWNYAAWEVAVVRWMHLSYGQNNLSTRSWSRQHCLLTKSLQKYVRKCLSLFEDSLFSFSRSSSKAGTWWHEMASESLDMLYSKSIYLAQHSLSCPLDFDFLSLERQDIGASLLLQDLFADI